MTEREFIIRILSDDDWFFMNKELEDALFELPSANIYIKTLIEHNYEFKKENLCKIFPLPGAENLFKSYIAQGFCLSDEAQIKLFDFLHAKTLVTAYKKKHSLCTQALYLASEKGWL